MGCPEAPIKERNGFDLLDARPPLHCARHHDVSLQLPGPMCTAVAVFASSARASARRVDEP